jgi:hypothetical protein
MSECTAAAAACRLSQHAASAQRALPAEPEQFTALDFLDRIGEIGIHWWSLIDRVLETHHSGKGKAEPLPDWAMHILRDEGRHSGSEEQYRQQRESLAEVMALENNQPTTFAFEVWGDRTTRLSVGHESVSDALPARDYWRANGHPNAKILKFRRMSNRAMGREISGA